MENCFEIKKRTITSLLKVEGIEFELTQRPLTRRERLANEQITHHITEEEGAFEVMQELNEQRRAIDMLKQEDAEKNKERIEKLEYQWRTSGFFKKYLEITRINREKNEEAYYQMVMASLSSHPFYKNENPLPDNTTFDDILDILDKEDFDKLVENAKKLTYLNREELDLVK